MTGEIIFLIVIGSIIVIRYLFTKRYLKLKN